MAQSIKPRVLMLGLLPIVVNAIFTPMIIGALVGFREFAKNSVYHIFLYGPYLWSIYDVVFAYLAFMFLRVKERISGKFLVE